MPSPVLAALQLPLGHRLVEEVLVTLRLKADVGQDLHAQALQGLLGLDAEASIPRVVLVVAH